jgi:hypothetical protein
MTPYSANPFVYIFSILAAMAALIWLTFAAVNRLGLEVSSAMATVTGKQHTAGSTTYNTNVVAGRAWLQSTDNPDFYAVALTINNEATVGLVSPELFAALQPNDVVQVKIRRTRITRKLEVVDVTR